MKEDELAKAERRAFHRGIWTGWKRGVDSHIKWGPIMQEFILEIVNRAMVKANTPEVHQKHLRRAIRDLEEIEVHKMLNSEDLTGVYDMPWNPLKTEGEEEEE